MRRRAALALALACAGAAPAEAQGGAGATIRCEQLALWACGEGEDSVCIDGVRLHRDARGRVRLPIWRFDLARRRVVFPPGFGPGIVGAENPGRILSSRRAAGGGWDLTLSDGGRAAIRPGGRSRVEYGRPTSYDLRCPA